MQKERTMANPELNEAEVDWCKQMFSDLVPYDDPNYEKRLDALARSAILGERDPDFIAMCEEHDRMMKANLCETTEE